MPVVVRLSSGERYVLDRNLLERNVVKAINDKRGTGKFVEFPDNRTPSRSVYFDPDLVSSIQHDGHNY